MADKEVNELLKYAMSNLLTGSKSKAMLREEFIAKGYGAAQTDALLSSLDKFVNEKHKERAKELGLPLKKWWQFWKKL